MKRFFILSVLLAALGLSSFAHAQDAAPAAAAPAAEAPAAAPAADAAPAAAAPAEVPNKGDTAWMIVATAFVLAMAVPALALFYGGMVRTKNMLSICMQTFMTFSLLTVLWFIYGYSIAFTQGPDGLLGQFMGGTSRFFLQGLTPDSTAATWSKGVVIPEYIYMCFQCTFAAITPCLILGGFAERMKFSAVLAFMVLWFTFSYLPIAHMVWFWAGPDAYTDAAAGDKANAIAGFLFQKGAIDFAGGTVVHINAGIAGLIGALVLGKRVGYGKEPMPPHSIVMTMIGGALLWMGWFGFNVGSNLEATGVSALAFANTFVATAVAAVVWTFLEWIFKGKPSMLGCISGAITGLVAITPACGFVGPMGAIVIGAIPAAVCLWAVNGLKKKLGYDDTLDVFGVHCIGGILGAMMTGIFVNPALGGTGVYDYVANAVAPYDMTAQLISQAKAVGMTLIWSGTVAFISYKLVDLVIGLRVSEEVEREGLDISEHGESAYHM